MRRKSKIIVSITGIVLVSLILLGLTFGYYLTQIVGNKNDKSITLSLADLQLTYSDGNGLIEAEKVIPGEDIDVKTFSVENTGNAKVKNYTVYLDSVVNTFADKSDVRVELSCTSSNGGNCSGANMEYPSSSAMLSVNDINVGEVHNYELKVVFLETNDDQSDNMNKTLSGNIIIKDLVSTGKTSSSLASNEIITLENNDYIKNYRIYGNSIQNGTPSPTSPVNIQSVGDYDSKTDKYVIPVVANGKNLFPKQVTKTQNGVTLTIDDAGIITLNGTCTASYNFTVYSTLLPGKYSLIDFAEGDFPNDLNSRVQVYEDGVVFLGTQNSSNGNAVFTGDVTKAARVQFRVRIQSGFTYNNSKLKPMLVHGEYSTGEITDYEPYKEIRTNLYLDEPLRKINGFSDYIDFQEQKVVRNIKEIELNGTETWNLYPNNSVGTVFTIGISDSKLEYESSLSTHYTNIMYAWDPVYIDRIGIYSDHNTAKIKYFRAPNLSITTPEAFKTWLISQNNIGNTVKLDYSLVKPIEQNIELPSILLQDGINNISVGTSIQPSNVEYEIIK